MTTNFRFESSFEVEIDDRYMAVANVMQELPYSSAWRCKVNPTLLMVGIWAWKRTEKMGKTLSTLRKILGLASDPNRDAYLCEKYRKHRQQYRVILSNEYSEVDTASMETYGWHTCWDIDGAYRKSCLITAEYLRDYCIIAKVYDENNHFIFRRLYWRKSDEHENIFVVPNSRYYHASGMPTDSIKKECNRIIKEALGLKDTHKWNRRDFEKSGRNYFLNDETYFDTLSDYVLHPKGISSVPCFEFDTLFDELDITEDSKVKCDNCGEYATVDSKGRCNDCDDSHVCDCCGERSGRLDSYYTASGETLCVYCYDNYYGTCSCCEEIFHSDNMTWIESEETLVCNHCRDRKYEYCRGCDEWHLSSSMDDTEDGYRCEYCIENEYYRCDNCGTCVRDVTKTEDGKDYCPDCHEDNTSNEEDDVEIEWTEKV